ncbi:MAG: hypothetical protein G01um101416_816, partial [Microgenomates group bacterium Gr01-1014_16]
RFLTMVATAMKWPANAIQYLDTSNSTLNPHNIGYGFYVYGTFPVILVKFIAEALKMGDYNGLTLVGRAVSGILDLGTVVLVFLISRRLFKSTSAALLAMFVYAISVLPIQLSHFFAVDTPLVFFLVLSFYLLIMRSPFLGIAFGLAVASKISVVLFAPVILIGFVIHFFSHSRRQTLLFAICFLLFAVLTVRLAYPYMFDGFVLNQKLLTNWRDLNAISQPNIGFPPATQWFHAQPGVYSLNNLLYLGFGLPLGVIALAALSYALIRFHRHPFVLLAIGWTIPFFIYQSLQFAQAMRYTYPVYPFLAIANGIFLYQIFKINKFLFSVVITLVLVWPLAFISIYSRPHSRVVASEWMLKNIPSGSSLACEHWDDCLPLGYHFPPYIGVEFPLYGPDTPQKWIDMNQKLAQVDYIVLSSNRLYGSIMTLPERFPQTTKYYQSLFDGSLGFTPVAQFTSRPNLPIPGLNICLAPSNIIYGKIAKSIQDCPLPGISFVDDYADETFTVIDHPKVIIFKKTSPFNGFNESSFQ